MFDISWYWSPVGERAVTDAVTMTELPKSLQTFSKTCRNVCVLGQKRMTVRTCCVHTHTQTWMPTAAVSSMSREWGELETWGCRLQSAFEGTWKAANKSTGGNSLNLYHHVTLTPIVFVLVQSFYLVYFIYTCWQLHSFGLFFQRRNIKSSLAAAQSEFKQTP